MWGKAWKVTKTPKKTDMTTKYHCPITGTIYLITLKKEAKNTFTQIGIIRHEYRNNELCISELFVLQL